MPEGIAATLPFFQAILDDEVFVSDDYTTGFVAGRMDDLKIEPATLGETGEVAVNRRLFRVRVYADERAGDGSCAGNTPRRKREGVLLASADEGEVPAPMQGTIVKVPVEKGQKVEADEPVCILKAMKMESGIRTFRSGTVAEVRVEVGQAVRAGSPLIFIE